MSSFSTHDRAPTRYSPIISTSYGFLCRESMSKTSSPSVVTYVRCQDRWVYRINTPWRTAKTFIQCHSPTVATFQDGKRVSCTKSRSFVLLVTHTTIRPPGAEINWIGNEVSWLWEIHWYLLESISVIHNKSKHVQCSRLITSKADFIFAFWTIWIFSPAIISLQQWIITLQLLNAIKQWLWINK